MDIAKTLRSLENVEFVLIAIGKRVEVVVSKNEFVIVRLEIGRKLLLSREVLLVLDLGEIGRSHEPRIRVVAVVQFHAHFRHVAVADFARHFFRYARILRYVQHRLHFLASV